MFTAYLSSSFINCKTVFNGYSVRTRGNDRIQFSSEKKPKTQVSKNGTWGTLGIIVIAAS
jgi:hypothetical protein